MGLNCDDEKMAVISSTSTTNEWPQKNNNVNIHMISNALNSNNNNMASTINKSQQDQQQQTQQNQEALKCPRCDSSNTKFCYYNNYSLSQPRHFCKACKRYWTRGGTLRNVPVGGGCRKNKRIKRPSSGAGAAEASSSPNSSSSTSLSSLFYNHDLSALPSFSRFSSTNSGFDHVPVQPAHVTSSLGLGSNNNSDSYLSGLIGSGSGYASIFGAATSATGSAAPTIASLLASKFVSGGRGLNGNFQSLPGFDGNINNLGGISEINNNNKVVKLESDGNGMLRGGLDWINGGNGMMMSHHHDNDQTEEIVLSSDPSLFWTNPTAVGAATWHDPANVGSNSVPSLI